MNIARTAVGACSLNGILYALGGECALADTQDDTLYLRCMECYDPVLRAWIPLPEMKVARSFVAVAGVSRFIYAIGEPKYHLYSLTLSLLHKDLIRELNMPYCNCKLSVQVCI